MPQLQDPADLDGVGVGCEDFAETVKTALMRLPADALAAVCSDWLTVRELARLDWAMSERTGRAKLLEVLAKSVCVERGEGKACTSIKNDCLVWLGNRGVGGGDDKVAGVLPRFDFGLDCCDVYEK